MHPPPSRLCPSAGRIVVAPWRLLGCGALVNALLLILTHSRRQTGRCLPHPRRAHGRFLPPVRQNNGVSLSDDQIYERYQARAIAEMNELGREIAAWIGERHPAQAPVIGTGHPLADIFLLKYRPMPAEVEEGVAFFGRAGRAVLGSVERLRIDPLKLYGTVS